MPHEKGHVLPTPAPPKPGGVITEADQEEEAKNALGVADATSKTELNKLLSTLGGALERGEVTYEEFVEARSVVERQFASLKNAFPLEKISREINLSAIVSGAREAVAKKRLTTLSEEFDKGLGSVRGGLRELAENPLLSDIEQSEFSTTLSLLDVHRTSLIADFATWYEAMKAEQAAEAQHPYADVVTVTGRAPDDMAAAMFFMQIVPGLYARLRPDVPPQEPTAQKGAATVQDAVESFFRQAQAVSQTKGAVKRATDSYLRGLERALRSDMPEVVDRAQDMKAAIQAAAQDLPERYLAEGAGTVGVADYVNQVLGTAIALEFTGTEEGTAAVPGDALASIRGILGFIPARLASPFKFTKESDERALQERGILGLGQAVPRETLGILPQLRDLRRLREEKAALESQLGTGEMPAGAEIQARLQTVTTQEQDLLGQLGQGMPMGFNFGDVEKAIPFVMGIPPDVLDKILAGQSLYGIESVKYGGLMQALHAPKTGAEAEARFESQPEEVKRAIRERGTTAVPKAPVETMKPAVPEERKARLRF